MLELARKTIELTKPGSRVVLVAAGWSRSARDVIAGAVPAFAGRHAQKHRFPG
jgi:hypothetical protein